MSEHVNIQGPITYLPVVQVKLTSHSLGQGGRVNRVLVKEQVTLAAIHTAAGVLETISSYPHLVFVAWENLPGDLKLNDIPAGTEIVAFSTHFFRLGEEGKRNWNKGEAFSSLAPASEAARLLDGLAENGLPQVKVDNTWVVNLTQIDGSLIN